ncbi:hypothetical protein ACJMK2_035200 [Sinanodonta woodiana]|uniref:RAD50-interacting protein 1 n=1 Tax=Sinanodonta woodiana TaxID=1069815 RepID=A0ABD3WVL6_SINWO
MLHSSQCINLVGFAKETTLFWYKILRDKIAREFEDVLKQLNWPLIVTTIKTPPVHNPVETREKMDHLFKQLLQLQLPNSLNCDGQITPAGVAHILGLKPPILPLQLMLKSMRKRFRYHFYGKKQTNDLGKPEWYFTQVLSWIRDHRDFLDQRIQPLLNEAGRHSIDAKLEFMRGVVSFVIEKIDSDLPELMYDEHKFSHLVDEALLFDHELHLNYGYPTSYPSSLHVLTEGTAFEKWISVEKKFALEKLDFMMSSSTAWKSQYKDIADVDEMKVPECGESFMTLMLTITDRYKHLPHPAHKIQFLDLQLELLEDFRIRIVQVMKDVTHSPLGDRYCAILNTTYYISEVLREWSELVFFVQLQYYKTQFASQSIISGNKPKGQQSVSMDRSYFVDAMEISDLDESSLPLESTVFEDMIQLFDRMRHDMLKTIVYHVFTDVKARSKPYRDARWLALPSQKDVVLGLSTSACEMLLVLKDHLLEVGQKISKPLFASFWEKLAEKLNKFIYEEVILPNHFNEGGSAQLQFDMTRNLFPLFGEYTQRPESYFRDVKEACILLNLKRGSALLLNDVLAKASQKTKKSSKSNDSDAKNALHEVGVFTLSLKQAAAVLKLRADLTT